MRQTPFKVLSCDPGTTGALVKFENGVATEFISMPKMYVPANNKAGKKYTIDLTKLDQLFRDFKPDMVVIEKVRSMPGQGVTSMFTFGEGYGLLKALAQAHSKSWCEVRPQEWKKHFNLIGSEKYASIIVAENKTDRKLSSGKADAFLIGRWWIENEASE